MRERDLLDHICRRSAGMPGSVIVGPGDDCAVVEIAGAHVLVATDQLVGGRHFDPDATPPDLVARKAIARNVSDVAAMGGTPSYALCAAQLPGGYPHADELFDHAHRWANRFGCPLVGGDIATTTGPLALAVTILGTPHPTRGPVLRSDARPGDHVFVTGPLGNSYASGWHLAFEPRVEVAQRVAPDASAMIDLSDGLGVDAGRVAKASGVRLELSAHALPLRDGAASWRSAIGDGEDYELLVCSASERIAGLTRIGRVVEGEGCIAIDGDVEHDVSQDGWEHA